MQKQVKGRIFRKKMTNLKYMRISNKYDDEIGKLADTINHMAGELDKTERKSHNFCQRKDTLHLYEEYVKINRYV